MYGLLLLPSCQSYQGIGIYQSCPMASIYNSRALHIDLYGNPGNQGLRKYRSYKNTNFQNKWKTKNAWYDGFVKKHPFARYQVTKVVNNMQGVTSLYNKIQMPIRRNGITLVTWQLIHTKNPILQKREDQRHLV